MDNNDDENQYWTNRISKIFSTKSNFGPFNVDASWTIGTFGGRMNWWAMINFLKKESRSKILTKSNNHKFKKKNENLSW